MLDQMDLIDIYRIFHPKASEYTFFSTPTDNLLKLPSHPHFLVNANSSSWHAQLKSQYGFQ
ncbi:Hypothetical predicted protein [Lynx pardinus]|uniref:Uncharacterized protein n=1 Tax=Lynx pardinus TaxID=191816 RepID=A0A485MFM2_LYNPA|nr:Hypothetical predicted protein [Lynx pardinus]